VKRSTGRSAQGPKVPLVKSQQVERLVAAREHDDRRVCEPDIEIAMRLDHLMRNGNVAGVERFEPICAARDLSQQSERRMRADAGPASPPRSLPAARARWGSLDPCVDHVEVGLVCGRRHDRRRRACSRSHSPRRIPGSRFRQAPRHLDRRALDHLGTGVVALDRGPRLTGPWLEWTVAASGRGESSRTVGGIRRRGDAMRCGVAVGDDRPDVSRGVGDEAPRRRPVSVLAPRGPSPRLPLRPAVGVGRPGSRVA
jgi:hypothetical protein